MLWTVAGAGTQQLIWEAHQAAVAEMLQFMEREVAATSSDVLGPDGQLCNSHVVGLMVTVYDHYDFRLSDPHFAHARCHPEQSAGGADRSLVRARRSVAARGDRCAE